MLRNYESALRHLPEGVREAEINEEFFEETTVTVADGQIADTRKSQSDVFYVRTLGYGKGYAYTEDLTENAENVIRRAALNGTFQEAEDQVGFHKYEVPRFEDEHCDGYELHEMIDHASDLANEITGKITHSVKLELTVRQRKAGQRIVNSNGFDIGYAKPQYILSALAGGAEGDYVHAADYTRSAKTLDDFDPDEFADSLDNCLSRQYHATGRLSSGSYETVLANTVVRNIFVTAWQIFSGMKALSSSTPAAGLLNKQIASELINIKDIPSFALSGFDIPYDCEGTKCKEADLVRSGVLVGFMQNLSTSAHLSMENTGNAGRRALLSGSIPIDVGVIPRNFIIEPGEKDPKELIGEIDKGAYITSSSDVFHTIDIASGDFNIPCLASKIENGIVTENCGPVIITGNLIDLLKNADAVGSDLYMGVMDELMNYGIGVPSLRVRDLYISSE